MAPSPFGVSATAGSLRLPSGLALTHSWTEQGIVTSPVSNGAQVLHLSVAVCILNDTYREAQRLGVAVAGVAVDVDGAFDDQWCSTGIGYSVRLDTDASPEDVTRLTQVVDDVAEVPRAVRAGAPVTRRP